MVIWASQHIGPDWDGPGAQGRRFADALLAAGDPWPTEPIILNISPGTMISAFFRALLQRVAEVRPAALESALTTKWEAPYAFQRESIARWMVEFKPELP